ncbi:MAG: 2'-5' RNA ligase family protein [Azonexus sp.]|jgi:2'-5' RNA ligase|nr:2'-5' RNA ligase family protein [Azonexus sp.]
MPLLTQPCEQKDFVDWRQGRRYFAVWALDLDRPDLRQASAEIRAALAAYWLPGYARQPHLTIGICGFPEAVSRRADDYGFAHLSAQCQALVAAAPASFCLEIGAPDSFASAAYFSVRDLAGGIPQLRQILAGGDKDADDDAGFVPHVTFGLYQAVLPLPEVLAELRASNPLPQLRLTVGKLAWMVYEAAVIGGPLLKVGEFDLASGRFEVLADELFKQVFA